AALSDFDRDGRTDLVISQNGAPTTLYRNRSGLPGLRVRLVGLLGNEAGVGAVLRVQYKDGSPGPARVITAGSGYWSQSSLEAVLGVDAMRVVQGVWVRWPNGHEQESAVEPGTREVNISYAEEQNS
ncbi:MAG TPA: ASPIC/UnbV domain-containing protein, partial [Rhodothermales bacterium]|nr:ASPIC/UnbV domain-containing protein [Rhodothermales bacterium]